MEAAMVAVSLAGDAKRSLRRSWMSRARRLRRLRMRRLPSVRPLRAERLIARDAILRAVFGWRLNAVRTSRVSSLY